MPAEMDDVRLAAQEQRMEIVHAHGPVSRVNASRSLALRKASSVARHY
jgi:hypothetical protein